MNVRFVIIPLVIAGAAAVVLGCTLKLEKEGTTPALKEHAPDFSLVSHSGDQVSLDSLTAKGPAIVIFYRGYW